MTSMTKHRADGSAATSYLQGSEVLERPVLVAVDMSDASRSALLWACEYAATVHLPVTALHVVHDPAEAPGTYHRDSHSPLRPAVEIAEEMLTDFLAGLQADHPGLAPLALIDRKLAEGLPAHTIVNMARRLNASQIVLGCRGQSGLQRLMNGSTAHKVMQLAPIAVTIVKEHEML